MQHQLSIKHHYNPHFGVAFSYPSAWLVMDNNDLGGIQLFPGHAEESGEYQDNLSIIVRSQGGKMEADPAVLAIMANELLKSNSSSFDQYILFSLEAVHIHGIPARQLHFGYQAPNDKAPMLGLQLVTLYRGKLFLYSYISREHTYDAHLGAVKALIDGVELT